MILTLGIGALIAAALLAGVVYLVHKLTVSFLKSYRKKKTSKIIAAKVKDFVKEAPKVKFEDLDMEEEDVIIVEYDEEENEVVQDVKAAKAENIDDVINGILNDNEGIVVFE